MAKRVSDEIDDVDVFTYDTDLLAKAHELTRPRLIELARPRRYVGISKFRKADLAIIVADTWTAERDEQTLREEYEGTEARFSPEVIDQLHERAAAIDEKRTIARAYLCAPSNEVLSWAEIEQGYLDAMAERDRIEHNQAVIGSDKWNAAMLSDEPRDIDTWLTHGMVLVGPQSGDHYRFERWDGGTAVLRTSGGLLVRIRQADVTTWQYLPKASAAGVAEAKRRVPWRETFVMHERTGQRYRVLGMDNIVTGKLIISHDCGSKCSEHERAISPGVLQWDYIACDENGNVQPLPRNSLNRRSAPAYAVGDRVRWSEDSRPMFVREVTPTGAYVAPTPDGHLFAFAAYEDLSPEKAQPVKVPPLQVFTAGELYAAPEMPKANVVLNLATLLDDPARRLPADLVRTDGTRPAVFNFVFASDGAEELFASTVRYLGGLIKNGPVVLLVLCRGGKHRSVAFGDAIARHFGAPVTHFHKDLVPYGTVSE